MEPCKNYQKCPIYSGILQDIKMASNAYRKYYCDAGEAGWASCRRYQVKEKGGKVPEKLLPNSHLTVEQIIKQFGLTPATAQPAPTPGQVPGQTTVRPRPAHAPSQPAPSP